MSKSKLPLNQALPLAEKIVKELLPYCARIEIAGSIRRKRPEIGDIEIVCIPLCQVDLFGNEGASLLNPYLEILAQEGRIIKSEGQEKRWGEKYKKFHIPAMPELNIDLFITTPAEWGYTFTIRTGSADFSRRIVTPKQKGGYLPGHLHVGECRLWKNGQALETPEEEDIFKALGLEWIPPEERL